MAELFNILAKGAISASVASSAQVFNDAAFTVIEAFDTINVQRGGMTCNIATNTVTVADTGLYTFEGGINADFGANDELQLRGYINGTPTTGQPFSIQGAGTGQPVTTYWISHGVPLTAGDVVDLRAKNGDAGNLQPNIDRVTMTLTKDSP